MHHRIPFFLALRWSVRPFQMPLEGLSFVKTLAKFGIIKATDSLIQNIIKIVYFRWFIFDILSQKPWRPCWFTYARQFSKVRLVFHMLYLWKKVRNPPPPPPFFISETSNSLSDRSGSLKKIYRVEHFRANVLKLNEPRHWRNQLRYQVRD